MLDTVASSPWRACVRFAISTADAMRFSLKLRGPKPPRSSNFWLEETGLHQRFAAVLCIVALAVVGRKSLLGGELLQVLAGFAVVVDDFARLHQLVADEGGLEYAVFSHRSLLLRLRRGRSGSWSACPVRTARCRR